MKGTRRLWGEIGEDGGTGIKYDEPYDPRGLGSVEHAPRMKATDYHAGDFRAWTNERSSILEL